jgi:NH3-dependent NAD+ synthetase
MLKVYRIARWLNAIRKDIPDSILITAPSTELRPCQTDQDTLSPCEVLNAILQKSITQHQSGGEIIAQGFDPDTVKWGTSPGQGGGVQEEAGRTGVEGH